MCIFCAIQICYFEWVVLHIRQRLGGHKAQSHRLLLLLLLLRRLGMASHAFASFLPTQSSLPKIGPSIQRLRYLG
jgi:hypothetical protein